MSAEEEQELPAWLLEEPVDPDDVWAEEYLARLEREHGGNGFADVIGRAMSAEELRAAQERARRAVDDGELKPRVDEAYAREKAVRAARRRLNAEELAAGGDDASVLQSFAEGAATEPSEDEWRIHSLLPEDGRTIISAFRKSGKTVLSLNLMRCLVTGSPFLGFYEVRPVAEDETVLWMNLELTQRNAERWMRKMNVAHGPGDRMYALHVRGSLHHYQITTDEGRERIVRKLREARAVVWVIDPVAPLMAACGLSTSDDRDVAIFQAAVDRVAAEAEVREVIYVAHVGKAPSAGDETAKGSTRWEDATDSIIILGRSDNGSTDRWIRATVRDGDELQESTLIYNPDDMSLELDLGADRTATKLKEAIRRVIKVCIDNPGIKKGELLTHPQARGVRTEQVAAAVAEASSQGYVMTTKDRSATCHYPTGLLPDWWES